MLVDIFWEVRLTFCTLFTNNRKHCSLSATLAKVEKFSSHHRLLIQGTWWLQGARGFTGIHPGILSTVHFALIKWLLLYSVAFIVGTIWCGWLGDFHQRSCTEKWIHLGILWRGKARAIQLQTWYVATLFWIITRHDQRVWLEMNEHKMPFLATGLF